MKIRSDSFNHILPDLRAWPIYRLSASRDNFVRDIIEDSVAQLKEKNEDVEELIAKALFQELQRIKIQPWKVDPPNEKQYWNRIKKQLSALSELDPEQRKYEANEILVKIVRRYAHEIVGHFKISTFKFARIFLTIFFKILFDQFFTGPFGFWGNRRTLKKRLHATGNIELARTLWNKGVVIFVPTHSSNLDSIFVGYVIDLKVGMPSSSYGAGLNLFNSEITAYYMNRLGAYRVDRRKKNAIYLETLKSSSRLSIYKKVNNLFFPGGTRSRSGEIEQHLKLGLMGTAIEAQRMFIEKGDPHKVFIVPVVISYPNVLEGHSLIEQYLRKAGKTKYIAQKGIAPFFRWIWYGLWDLFSKRSDAYLSFGPSLDILGNEVDENGTSFDPQGNEIDIREYFTDEVGKVNKDLQRESVYTKRLSEEIAKSYLRINVILRGHTVAYALFDLIYKKFKAEMDFYEMFNLPPEDTVIEYDTLVQRVTEVKSLLLESESAGHLKVVFDVNEEPVVIIKKGIREISNYHWKHPARIAKGGMVRSDNLKLLYFYHNRIASYPAYKENTEP
jgi:glycerol-3-phosphate O-acyltransferase